MCGAGYRYTESLNHTRRESTDGTAGTEFSAGDNAGAMSAFCFGAGLDGVQFLAGLEPNSFSRSDADFGAGAGIAADSGFAGAYAEYAKSAQFDALA